MSNVVEIINYSKHRKKNYRAKLNVPLSIPGLKDTFNDFSAVIIEFKPIPKSLKND